MIRRLETPSVGDQRPDPFRPAAAGVELVAGGFGETAFLVAVDHFGSPCDESLILPMGY